MLSKLVITDSEFSKKEIVKYLNVTPNKIVPILLGVDFGFNSNFVYNEMLDKYILFVGNILPHKNLLLAIKSFSKISHKDVKFYIVGRTIDSVKEKQLLNEISSLGNRVVFTGKVNDSELKNYYSNASLFLFPSKYEGFGLPILEAMIFNLPILCSNAASIPEVGGDKVEYFNPNDEEDLINKLNDFFNNFNEKPQVDYSSHLKKYSWKKTADKHIEIFLNITKIQIK